MTRIAVSGVGGGVGQSILKALQGTRYRTVALDGAPLATGLYAAEAAHLVPYANDPAFVDAVIEVCRSEGCSMFFPGLDAELPIVARARETFAANGIRAIVSTPKVVAISDDKLLTFETLRDLGLPAPHTVDMGADSADGERPSFPLILKKRIGGARSQDVFLLRDEAELERLKASGRDLSPFVAQEFIDGDEYTCGTVTLGGRCRGVIVMRRILRDGDTYKCFSVDEPAIESLVRRLVEAIRPDGACNIQLRVRDGIPYVFEINARCSGTTAARALCGFNEPLAIADYHLRGEDPEFSIRHQAVLRYWKELVVPDAELETLASSGQLAREKARLL